MTGMTPSKAEIAGIIFEIAAEIVRKPPIYYHPKTGSQRCAFCHSQTRKIDQHEKNCPVRTLTNAEKAMKTAK